MCCVFPMLLCKHESNLDFYINDLQIRPPSLCTTCLAVPAMVTSFQMTRKESILHWYKKVTGHTMRCLYLLHEVVQANICNRNDEWLDVAKKLAVEQHVMLLPQSSCTLISWSLHIPCGHVGFQGALSSSQNPVGGLTDLVKLMDRLERGNIDAQRHLDVYMDGKGLVADEPNAGKWD